MKTLPAFLFRAVVLLLLCLQTATAEMCESTGEYEYTHGDNESIIQAKQFCEHMALRAAIEQCALFVSSTSNIQNYQLRDDLVNTIAAAVVRNKKILDQRVNGRTVYYKVSVKIDDTQMTQAIESERARLNPAGTSSTGETVRERFKPQETPVETPAQTSTKAEERTEAVQAPIQRPKPAPTLAGGVPTRQIAVRLGQKSLAEGDDWEPVEKQGVFGIAFDMPLGSTPLSLDLGFQLSTKTAELEDDDDFEVTGETTELGLGLRYYLGAPEARVRPYGAVALAFTGATYTLVYTDSGDEYTSEMSANATGVQLGGGVLLALSQRVTLGAELRISTASVELEGEDLFGDPVTFETKAGGTTFALTAGYRF